MRSLAQHRLAADFVSPSFSPQKRGPSKMAKALNRTCSKFTVKKKGSVAKIHRPHKVLWPISVYSRYRMWSKYFLHQSQYLFVSRQVQFSGYYAGASALPVTFQFTRRDLTAT